MMKNNMKNDNLGSIGIGAMIVFIALILVAAVDDGSRLMSVSGVPASASSDNSAFTSSPFISRTAESFDRYGS